MYENNYKRKLKQSIDWKLVICYLLLIFIGFINIYASIHSSSSGSPFDFSLRSGKQFAWILTSIGLAILILFAFNPRLWEVISLPTYIAIIILLVAVIIFGVEVNGSHSWFALGPVRFQPAEISKIATSLLLATIMSQPNYKISKTKDFFISLAIIGLPMMIIIAENETGSALVYLGFAFVLYREGLSGWFIFLIGLVVILFITTLTLSPFDSIIILLGLLSLSYRLEDGRILKWVFSDLLFCIALLFLPKIWSAPWAENIKIQPLHIALGICLIGLIVYSILAFKRKNSGFLWLAELSLAGGLLIIASTNFIFNNVLQEHQQKRIEVLLGMMEDPRGVGYNVNQSMIAIGSGGLIGKGFLHGTQTSFGFVPEQSTDFIFCTVGEEWGFIGCLFIIALYLWMITRLVLDAEKCRASFTRIYGYCVASLIFMHLFINIGMTIGLMPVIGIPLPFLSYGGSSLWAFTILLFIFIALYKEEKKYF